MVQVSVANMHCAGCAKGVQATLERVVPGVSANFDFERRRLRLDVPGTGTDAILAALIADGWEAQVVESEAHQPA